MQVFLLHFAGGNCYSYDFLKNHFDSDCLVYALELPGRGKRYGEGCLFEKSEAIEDYTQQIQKLRNVNMPYILYGHSMGATLGLSVVKEMEKNRDAPVSFIASGNPGPGVKFAGDDGKIPRYLMEDDNFKEELRSLGGMPEEVLETPELYEFFAPIIRADFEVLEKESFSEKGMKIQTPIYAMMGTEEENVDRIDNWQLFTTNTFQSKVLEGDHFFILDHPKIIVATMMNHFKSSLITW